MTRVCLHGFGKMNKTVAEQFTPEEVTGVVSLHEKPGVKWFTPNFRKEAFAQAEVVIDFSNAETCIAAVNDALELGKNVVFGTTGLKELEAVRKTCEKTGVSAVYSPNYSIGVNAFLKTIAFAVPLLEYYDVSIVEQHHRFKKDKPSGTALKIADVLKTAGVEACEIQSIRGGDTPGNHQIIFSGNSERLVFEHEAFSRACFARGVKKAVEWVCGKKDGRLYLFSEILG